MKRILLVLLALLPVAASAVVGEDNYLQPDDAFKFNIQRIGEKGLIATFEAAPHHYLYRDHLKISLKKGSTELPSQLILPKGEMKADPNFGTLEIFHSRVQGEVKITGDTAGITDADITATYRGCSEQGLCYRPITKIFKWSGISPAAANPIAEGPLILSAQAQSSSPAVESTSSTEVGSETDQIAGLFKGGSFITVIAAFFVAGLLLAFTPCVFPMIPILSGIIVGSGEKIEKSRAFVLSLAYVLGMAITYALAGVAAGLSGKLLSAALQNPWVLGGFALIFVILSLSMFGFYELQLPNSIQSKFNDASSKVKGGSTFGAFTMGALSAVIVGPCVAPPLAGALLYISQSHNVVLGGSALFAMALGIGVPLMLVGTSAGALLPRAGGWMDAVKKVFGVLLLGVVIWLVMPVLPITATMLLIGGLLVMCAIYLSAIDPLPQGASGILRFGKGAGVLSLIAGTAMLVGALSGGRDLLQPLGGFKMANAASPANKQLNFKRVANVAELDNHLRAANGRPVVLDFYADWCVSCKEMEHNTFSDGQVQAKLKGAILLQADVTSNSDEQGELLKRFGLFGPPGIVFFDPKGTELHSAKVIGYQAPQKFLASLDRVPGLN